MICLIQRVEKASVTIGGKPHSEIGRGYVVFLGVGGTDTESDVTKLVQKLSLLRIMDDGNGKMNLSIKDISGEVLLVSQFTLMANLKGGRRPDFFPAMEPVGAKRLYELFAADLKNENIKVKTGVFAAYMKINLINDGPVTFILDSTRL